MQPRLLRIIALLLVATSVASPAEAQKMATAEVPPAALVRPGKMIAVRPIIATTPAQASTVRTATASTEDADELRLRTAGLPADPAGLLAFLNRRTRHDATPAQIAAFVAALGSAKPAERANAAAELVGAGLLAAPELRRAARDADPSIGSALADRCLKAVEGDSASVTAAAIRVLAARPPEGLTAALLAFLPNAEDEAVLEEVKNALGTVAQRDGHTDPALLAALQDPTGLRRAVAVEVLSLNGRAEPRAVLRKLLDDPTAAVRLRAALALADAREARAVTTLIALLGEPSTRESRVAEEYLQALAGEQGPKVALGDDAAAHAKCRDAWTAWWTAADGPALLADLVKCTGDPAVRDKALALIAKLGDESFDVRQQAAAELKGLGSFVVPYLRKATTNPDVEIRTRAATCLADLEKPGVANLAAVNFRLLALRRPAGAPAALLAYLPMAEDEAVVAEAQAALDVLAVSDGVADPEVVKALSDPVPIRRAAAAEALLSQSGLAPTGAAARLLKDPDAGVRLKAALALAGNRDRAAVPVLIALLTDLPPEQTIPVEDYLRRLAGDKPPLKPNETVHDADKTVRAKRRDAWAAWWTAEGANVQLPERLANPSRERYRGYTLLVQMQNGEVTELDASGKTRWTISGLVQPFDAQVLPGDRVLIAEFGANRVTERNLKGEILWEKAVNWPTNVRRLPGGGTFIAARAQILELDRSGKEVLNLTRPNDVMSAQKLRDGRIAVLSNRGNYQILDAAGKELKSFNVTVASYSNEVTPKGGVIVPVQYQNKVTEYDADGKTVWEATVNQPTAVARLPNGNTLVASEMGPVKLIEFDRAGKQVAETSTPNYTNRISRR